MIFEQNKNCLNSFFGIIKKTYTLKTVFLKNIGLLIFFVLFSFSIVNGTIAYAEVNTCIIGNETQGFWKRISIPHDVCLSPGPPALDSTWPTSAGPNATAYRIQGKYKVLSTWNVEFFTSPPVAPPDSGYRCITGYIEAVTNFRGIYNTNYMCGSSTECDYQFPTEGTLLSQVYVGPGAPAGGVVEMQTRFSEITTTYEWICSGATVPEPENNIGPECE